MGESFSNIVYSVFEKQKPLYGSKAIFIQRFEDSKKERPKSQTLQVAHPELYDFLLKKPSAKKFDVGIIHLDGGGAISKQLVSEGKSLLTIRNTLKEMIHLELLDLAQKMKDNPDSDLGKIDYLTAYSVLANHEDIAKEFGFEIYDIDLDPDMNEKEKNKWDTDNNKQRMKTYKTMNKIEPIKNLDKIIKKRPAKIALISRESLLKLLDRSLK